MTGSELSRRAPRDIDDLFAPLDRYSNLLGPDSDFVFLLDRTLATYRPFREDPRPGVISQAYPDIGQTSWPIRSFGSKYHKFASVIRRICLGFVSTLLTSFLLIRKTSVCTRFSILYCVTTTIGLCLSVLVSLRTQNRGAGFVVGSFVLSGGNGMIAVFHNKHKKLCSCYAQSSREAGEDIRMGTVPQEGNLEEALVENPWESHF